MSKVKIKKKSIIYILFFLAFIRPEYLIRSPYMNVFYDLYRIVVAGIIIFLFIMKKKKFNLYTCFWIMFEVWIVLVTILRNGNVSYAVNQAITISVIAIFFLMYSNDMRNICKSLYYVLFIFIIINFVTLLLFPNGMYTTGVTNVASENWFLGFKNKHMIYFLPFVALDFILVKSKEISQKNLFMIFIVAISAVFIKSSTTIVGLSIMLIIGFVPFIRKHYKIFNMYTYFGASIVMFVMIPLLRLQYLFYYFIVVVLKKSIDLTYRTDLWDRAFSAIRIHPILGWGEQVNEIKYALYHSQSIITAHNQILEYLYIGGTILIILYIIINLILASRLQKLEKSTIVQIASGMYIALQVALMVEVYTDAIIYMIYFILFYVENIVINRVKERKKQNA